MRQYDDLVKTRLTAILGELAATLIESDENFRQGQPAILVGDSDIPGVAVRMVIQLTGNSVQQPKRIWTPGPGEMIRG